MSIQVLIWTVLFNMKTTYIWYEDESDVYDDGQAQDDDDDDDDNDDDDVDDDHKDD